MKYIVLAALLALSGCMSVSGFERAIDAWKVVPGSNSANKVNYLQHLSEGRGPKASKRVEGRCSKYEGDIQLWCNCDNPIATDPESTAFESCMEPFLYPIQVEVDPATEPVETCQNLPSRQEFCSCRNPISDDPNHIYFRACVEFSEL